MENFYLTTTGGGGRQDIDSYVLHPSGVLEVWADGNIHKFLSPSGWLELEESGNTK